MARRWAKRSVIAAIVCVGLWLPATWALGQYLKVERPLERADAILVLAGGAKYNERNREAARLYHSGVAPQIILTNDGVMSGWDNERRRNPYFAERARWLLLAEEVPGDDIKILSETAGNGSFSGTQGTEDEADIVLRRLRDKDLNSILIVTSPYHSRRAVSIFEKRLLANGIMIEIGITYAKEAGLEEHRVDLGQAAAKAKEIWSEFIKLLLLGA